MTSTKQRLTRTYDTVDTTTLPDLLAVLLANIEDGLLAAGARPDVDYTFRDLLDAAMPIIRDQWNAGKLNWISSADASSAS